MSATRPVSVTHLPTNLVGLAAMLGGIWVLLARPEISLDVGVPALCLATALPILAIDVAVHKVHRRGSTGISWDNSRAIDPRRLATKLVGLAAVVLGVLTVYVSTPEYTQDLYAPFFRFLWWLGPAFLIAAPFYFGLLDQVLVQPQDKYWHLGALLTGRGKEADRGAILELIRGWVIKGFFIPLMYGFTLQSLEALRETMVLDAGIGQIFDLLRNTTSLVDVVFAALGYVVSLRVFDTHLRSTEPTMTGWVVAILCYMPFQKLVGLSYLNYADSYTWTEWTADWPVVQMVFAVSLLAGGLVFSGATVHFGCRFSNLTNRGTLTQGLYRLSKHPAYVAKLFMFLLQTVPFAPARGRATVAKNMLKWAVSVWIYFLRARTEEHHMSVDPDYVRYALWIDEHGVFSFLGRWFPALRYRPPEGWTDPGREPPAV